MSIFSFFNTKSGHQQIIFSEDQTISAKVVSQPELDGNKQTFFITTSNFGKPVKIYLKTGQFPKYHYGDILKITGKIIKPENFSDFDWVNYLRKFGATATINNPEITLESKNGANPLIAKLYALRSYIACAIDKSLPEPESSLAKGILIGSKEGFSEDLLNKFNTVGITHIIALSGFNITIIVVFISAILLGVVGKKLNLLLSTIFVLFFVIMTGASASVVRAAIISILLIYGTTIGRKADKANLLLFAAVLMVAINPYILRYDTGFQLSFLAYCGLIYLAPTIKKLLEYRQLNFLPEAVRLILSETLSAQIFVLPLLLSTFNRFSIIAPISNILILPIIPISMLLVFIAVILYFILPILSRLAFLLSYVLLKYIVVITEYFSRIKYASLEISGDYQIILLIIYILAFSTFFYWLDKKWQKSQKT